ncbi:MAG: hypothetical protein ACRETF_09600 [Nevskiaceae bacterium]
MTARSKLLGLSAALLLCACAGQPPAPSTAAAPPKVGTAAQCVRDTGTRIQLPEGACVGQAGRVVTRDQIERTGATSPGQAYPLLGV